MKTGFPLKTLSFVLPAHNEEVIIEQAIRKLGAYLSKQPYASEILVVENGSRDRTLELARAMGEQVDGVPLRVFAEPNAGIGFAYDRGIREARAASPEGHWTILSAADLPFGFTDIEHLIPELEKDPAIEMALVSKFHPGTKVQATPLRRLATAGYATVRKLVLGMRSSDTQGVIFLKAEQAKAAAARVQSRDFFYTTELVYWAERARLKSVDLPALDQGDLRHMRASKVNLFRDTSRMLSKMLKLRSEKGSARRRA